MTIDIQPYLTSIRADGEDNELQHLYTPTDALSRQLQPAKKSRFPFDLQLKVQTVPPPQREGQTSDREQIERFNVLDGLRKYAANHVLLVGRPGSGKSTALQRLLWEEAQTPLEKLEKIPVLVELRQYKTSTLDLIYNFLKRHKLNIEKTAIEKLLDENRLLLLFDGVNELPNETARQDLNTFRQNYRRTPMIFTTRDIEVGGDLGIEKKLEMQPLTQTQMQQFVRAYLPDTGEEMLRRLGEKLQSFAQTPLLLLMLCTVFAETGDIPANLGLVFRSFAQSYNSKFWSSVQVSDEFRRWIPELLQHLAFTMMQGESPTEFRLAINEQDAKEILTKFLEGKVDYPPNKARAWLEELLKHHLIQYTSNKQIEFRHQLLQEYYAAECLLPQIKNISDAKLKKDYINYLEWTQTLALMLALLDNEAQAVRVVKLALDVDLMLGARLAGEVKRDYQEKTVKLILDLNIHQLLKTEFLGIAHSEYGISFLISALNHENAAIRRKAADSLGKLRNEQAVNSLMTALQDEDRYVRRTSAGRLGDIGNSIAVKALIKSLDDQDSYVVWNAAIALSKINFNYNPKVKNIIYHYKEIHIWLQKYLKPIEEFRNFRQNYELDIVKTKDLLKKNHNIDDIKILIQDLNSQNLRTRWNAEEILCKIGTPKILKKLWNLYLNNLNNYSSHNEEILNVFLTIQNRYLFYNFSFFACCLEGNDRNKSVKNSINRQEYEEILSILSNMSLVMERDTATFSKIGEEALRQHFLVQLNGRYKGQATGETFNSHGKTDILIRVDGKNIFIAECKFWGGSKLFQDTINQLLGYATWRDTKLAILIFNRNKNFSVVLEQIPPEVSKHPNFIRQLPYESETGFRFIIHHPDDKQRELILTVLAFDIPSETQH